MKNRDASQQSKALFPKVAEQPVMWGYETDPKPTDRHKAIVDQDTGKLFSIVSKNYRLIRHEDAIHEAEKAIFKLPYPGKYETTTEFYNDGGRMRRVYLFSERLAEIQKGDYVNPELHLSVMTLRGPSRSFSGRSGSFV